MIFQIVYFDGETELGASPWHDEKGPVEVVAKDGLRRHGATKALVIDDMGKVVATYNSQT